MFFEAIAQCSRRGFANTTMAVKARAVAVLTVVVLAVVVLAGGCGSNDNPGSEEPLDNDSLVNRVREYPTDKAAHTHLDVAYEQTPPTGGDHFEYWQNCHFYTSEVIDEVAVHSLEHGAVWVAYRPGIDAETLDVIKSRVESESHLLASPYPGLESPLVLSAWERQLSAEAWDDPAIEAFLNRYLGRRSPTAPEAGARCSKAIGTPDDPTLNYEEAVEQFLQSFPPQPDPPEPDS